MRAVSTFHLTPYYVPTRLLNIRPGQSTLPSSCPVCEHFPVTTADCKPNKSLRTTVRVFLRTEEKKREALRLKEVKNTPPDTPIHVDTTSIETEAPVAESQIDLGNDESVGAADTTTDSAITNQTVEAPSGYDNAAPTALQDIPQQSIEVSYIRQTGYSGANGRCRKFRLAKNRPMKPSL